MFKPRIVKDVSTKNATERVDYGNRHYYEDVDSFWQYVLWTDEAHEDPGMMGKSRNFREEGTSLDIDNTQLESVLQGSNVHFAADISWHHKGNLQFYHDEHAPPRIQIERPRKPTRRPKTETPEQYEQRLQKWESELPKDVDIKSKGNSMKMEYYTQNILPEYVQNVGWLRIEFGRGILQEDGDSSHGIVRSQKDQKARIQNIATQFKQDNWIETLQHPAQPPDLNPKEGIWKLLKERTRAQGWKNEWELRTRLLEEWGRINLLEIRVRIEELPWRCRMLVESGGKGIKSAV